MGKAHLEILDKEGGLLDPSFFSHRVLFFKYYSVKRAPMSMKDFRVNAPECSCLCSYIYFTAPLSLPPNYVIHIKISKDELGIPKLYLPTYMVLNSTHPM